MARLIDADELKKNFQDELCKGIACAECSMQAEEFCRVERWIDIAPTIETEPIKHGKWIDYGKRKVNTVVKELKCSECGSVLYWLGHYCPNCGARMDGGE